MNDPPRFLADAMLIRLARWLRVLDFDTVCYPQKPDSELVDIADAENRWLLTRDQALIRELRPDKPLLISSTRPLEQLTEVVQALDLPKPTALFRRCMMCNTPLRRATREEAETSVPEAGKTFHDEFLVCPGCQRVYWPGSHTRRMERTLHETFPHWFEAPE